MFYMVATIFTLSLELFDKFFIRMHPEVVFLEALGEEIPVTFAALDFSALDFILWSVEASDVVGQRLGDQHLEAHLTSDSQVFIVLKRWVFVVNVVVHY